MSRSLSNPHPIAILALRWLVAGITFGLGLGGALMLLGVISKSGPLEVTVRYPEIADAISVDVLLLRKSGDNLRPLVAVENRSDQKWSSVILTVETYTDSGDFYGSCEDWLADGLGPSEKRNLEIDCELDPRADGPGWEVRIAALSAKRWND